ncbi:MAG TPA: hypothetical protein PLD37_01285, partial [Usitatibacteraceae bacterium]|nr:hypothetical protein [Usitatibacteraceae bacterium]
VHALLHFTVGGDLTDRDLLTHEIAGYLAFEAQSIVGGGHVAKAIDDLTNVLRRNKLKLAPRFSMLLKALATIEMVGRGLDPDLDMVPIVRPYVERLIKRRYAPRQILRDLQHNARVALRLGHQMPRDISHLLQQLR